MNEMTKTSTSMSARPPITMQQLFQIGLADIAYVKAVPQHAGKEKAMESVFRLYNKYVYPGQAVAGAMDPKRLASVKDFYVEQGIVRKKSPLEELYTNQFVE